MKNIVAAFLCVLFAMGMTTSSVAQIPAGPSVTQSGSVTANDCVKWGGFGLIADAGSTCVGAATTNVLTNKTFDTAGTGNVLKINGTQVSAITGSNAVVLSTTPQITNPVISGTIGVLAVSSTTATNEAFTSFTNTGGVVYVGEESSVGSTIVGGSSAYAAVFNTTGANALDLGTNNLVRLTISSAGLVTMLNSAAVTGTLTVSAIASNTGAQSGYLCYNSGTGVITYDGSATCLVSTGRYKRVISHILPKEGLSKVVRMDPVSFFYTRKDLPKDEQVGLVAEEMAEVDPRLVSLDAQGLPRGVRYEQTSAMLIAAIKALKADNDDLHAEIRRLARRR